MAGSGYRLYGRVASAHGARVVLHKSVLALSSNLSRDWREGWLATCCSGYNAGFDARLGSGIADFYASQ